MTTPDRDAIRRRLEAATPGPWGFSGGEWGDVGTGTETIAHDIQNPADGDFIAHAPADIAALLAYTERLEKAMGDIRREMPQECSCTSDYTDRQRVDPICAFHDYGQYVLGLIDAALARREGV